MKDLNSTLSKLLELARQAPKEPGISAPPFLGRQIMQRQVSISSDSRRRRFKLVYVLSPVLATLLLATGWNLALLYNRPTALLKQDTDLLNSNLETLAVLVDQPPVWRTDLQYSTWLSVLISINERE